MKLLIDKNNIIIDIGDIILLDEKIYNKTKKTMYRNLYNIIEVDNIPSDILPQKNKYINGEFSLNENYIEPITTIPEKPLKTTYKKKEFLSLFTDEQWIKALQAKTIDPVIDLFFLWFGVETEINILENRVKNALTYLKDAEYITETDFNVVYGL